MLERYRCYKAGERSCKNICTIVCSSESYLHNSIIYFFVAKIEHHDDHLYLKKRERYAIFFTQNNNSLIIFIEFFFCDLFPINLKPFSDIYKMRRSEESHFFSEFFPEDLGEHLTDTSFSITSCDMKYSKRILRFSEYFHELQDIITTFFHPSRRQGHHIVYGWEIIHDCFDCHHRL